MSEMKPCPFCGNQASFTGGENHRCNLVYCEDCHIETDCYPTSAEAVTAWNTRPEEERLQRVILELDNFVTHINKTTGIEIDLSEYPEYAKMLKRTHKVAIPFVGNIPD